MNNDCHHFYIYDISLENYLLGLKVEFKLLWLDRSTRA